MGVRRLFEAPGVLEALLLVLLLVLAHFRVDETAFADPREQLVQFVRVEPDAVVQAGVDDDAACTVRSSHRFIISPQRGQWR